MTSRPATVRPATRADLDAVTALEAEVFGVDAWSAESVREELTGARRHAVVAELEGALVGYAVTLHSDDLVDLQRIAVQPSRRRRGVARVLLDELSRASRADGAHRMLLEVSAHNEAALAFYAARGFEQIDRRPRYYRDGSDALILAVPLAATTVEERVR